MTRLEAVPLADLRGHLEGYENHREVTRLIAAFLYKQGPSAPEIARWFDVREATVYAWFDRIESAEELAEALSDDPRPGRPTRLDPDQRRAFERDLRQDPATSGYDEETWTTSLAQDHLESTYGVDYSRRHVRRFLADVPSGGAGETDPDAATETAARER